jgi:hypothetical protein
MTSPRRQAVSTLAVTVIAIVVSIASTFTTECCDAYTLLPSTSFQTKRSVMYMKRGRGSFQKEVGGGSSSSSTGSSAGGIGSSSGSSFGAGGSNRNWLQVPDKTTDDLPTVEGKVQLLETQAYLLKNAQTNPNGAVSVLKYEGETYCFEANCPNCKVRSCAFFRIVTVNFCLLVRLCVCVYVCVQMESLSRKCCSHLDFQFDLRTDG